MLRCHEVPHRHDNLPATPTHLPPGIPRGLPTAFLENRFVFDNRDNAWYFDVMVHFFRRFVNNTQARAIIDVVFDGHYIDNSTPGEIRAFELMTNLWKTGSILYLHSQAQVASDMFRALAGPLANDQRLITYVEDVVRRVRADGTYSIDFQFIIDTWVRYRQVCDEYAMMIQQQASGSRQ
jgi:hypothetical protein